MRLRLEKGGKLLVDGKPFAGDPTAILFQIRDDAGLQVVVEAGEGIAEDDLKRFQKLVNAAREQRDPRKRELWEQIQRVRVWGLPK